MYNLVYKTFHDRNFWGWYFGKSLISQMHSDVTWPLIIRSMYYLGNNLVEAEDYSHNCSHFVEGNHMVDLVEVDTHSHFHKLCKYLCNKKIYLLNICTVNFLTVIMVNCPLINFIQNESFLDSMKNVHNVGNVSKVVFPYLIIL